MRPTRHQKVEIKFKQQKIPPQGFPSSADQLEERLILLGKQKYCACPQVENLIVQKWHQLVQKWCTINGQSNSTFHIVNVLRKLLIMIGEHVY